MNTPKTHDIPALLARIQELEKRKRVKPKPHPVETEKGTFLVARDMDRVYTKYRHAKKDAAVAEIKRLAKKEGDRFLLLKVVGILDKRPKQSQAGDQQ